MLTASDFFIVVLNGIAMGLFGSTRGGRQFATCSTARGSHLCRSLIPAQCNVHHAKLSARLANVRNIEQFNCIRQHQPRKVARIQAQGQPK